MSLPMRHPNRPDPIEKFPKRPPCDVVEYDDGRISFHYLTRAEAERILELAMHDRKLFPLCYALSTVLGINLDEDGDTFHAQQLQDDDRGDLPRPDLPGGTRSLLDPVTNGAGLRTLRRNVLVRPARHRHPA